MVSLTEMAVNPRWQSRTLYLEVKTHGTSRFRRVSLLERKLSHVQGLANERGGLPLYIPTGTVTANPPRVRKMDISPYSMPMAVGSAA